MDLGLGSMGKLFQKAVFLSLPENPREIKFSHDLLNPWLAKVTELYLNICFSLLSSLILVYRILQLYEIMTNIPLFGSGGF